MFTLQIAYEGDWVMVADPELVKQVFTGDPRVFHAGEGNQILRPILGENSVLVLDEKPHIEPAQAAAAALPRRADAGLRREDEPRSPPARSRAGRPASPTSCGRGCRRSRSRSSSRRSSASTAASGWSALRDALRDFLDLTTNPLCSLPVLLVGPDRMRRASPPSAAASSRVDELICARDRRAPRGRGPRPSATTSSRCWSPPATRTAAR